MLTEAVTSKPRIRPISMTSVELQRQMDDLWAVQDVCEVYGVTPMTVHLWRRDRNPPMPAVVIPGVKRPAVRFVESEVRAWAKAQGILTLEEKQLQARKAAS